MIKSNDKQKKNEGQEKGTELKENSVHCQFNDVDGEEQDDKTRNDQCPPPVVSAAVTTPVPPTTTPSTGKSSSIVTIKEALHELLHRQQMIHTKSNLNSSAAHDEQKYHHDDTRPSSQQQQQHYHQQRPIDVTAIILSTTINYTRKSAIFTIGDASLELNEYARVYMWNMSPIQLSNMMSLNIGRGDIVRFNRVALWKNYCSGKEITNTNSSSRTPRVICDFHFSWKDPETGHSLQRILKSSVTSKMMTTMMMMSKGAAGGREEEEEGGGHCGVFSNIYENRTIQQAALHDQRQQQGSESIIISTFMKQSIDEMVQWYARHQYTSSSTSTSGCLLLNENRNTLYKRRRLQELQFANMMSDIVVYVHRVDGNSFQNQQQQGHQSYYGGNLASGYAVLSDCPLHMGATQSESMVFFFESLAFHNQCTTTNRKNSSTDSLLAKLQGAYDKQEKVLITRVYTQKASAYNSTLSSVGRRMNEGVALNDCDEDLLVLLPTVDTIIEGVVESKSFVTLSKLVSIYYDDLDKSTIPLYQGMTEQKNEPPYDLVSMLVCNTGDQSNPRYEYRSATLTLQVDNPHPILSKEGMSIKVKASNIIMSTLCGDLLPEALANDRNHDHPDFPINLVLQILRGLTELDISLEWKLCQKEEEGEEVFVAESVHLLSLDFEE